MATVEVTFTPLPAHVRTARLVATAVARRSGVDESLLDEVRLAVGEACSRAVEAHRRHCPAEPVRIEMTDQDQRFVVTVSDHAPTAPARSAAPATDNGIRDARATTTRATTTRATTTRATTTRATTTRATTASVTRPSATTGGRPSPPDSGWP